MNAEHFRAFIWLRWRLFANRVRRGGAVNAAFTIFFAGVALFLSAVMALVAFCVGLFVLRDVAPDILLYVWDGLVAVFLFGWAVGVLVELQRSEPLSLDKFLHLPVSLTGAFLINYLSSLLTFSTILFLPTMLALGLALIIARGPGLLTVLPLLTAFFLMVTAVTYQFQGWLASLMTNPRRRRTVIVVVTMAFILSCQLPNLANMLGIWKNLDQDSAPALRGMRRKSRPSSAPTTRERSTPRSISGGRRTCSRAPRKTPNGRFARSNRFSRPGTRSFRRAGCPSGRRRRPGASSCRRCSASSG